MAVLGLVYSMKHSVEWNFSLLMVSVAVGGYMELIGSLAGFWQYHYLEPLAAYIVLSWPINTCAVHGLIYLAGIDTGTYKEGVYFDRLIGILWIRYNRSYPFLIEITNQTKLLAGGQSIDFHVSSAKVLRATS
jgi:hypothetical protein